MSVFARAGVTEKTVGIPKGTIEVMTANAGRAKECVADFGSAKSGNKDLDTRCRGG